MKTQDRNVAVLALVLVLLGVLGFGLHQQKKRRSNVVFGRWDEERPRWSRVVGGEQERERDEVGGEDEEEGEVPLIDRRRWRPAGGRRAQDVAGNEVIVVDGQQQQERHQDAVRDALREHLGFEIIAAEAAYVARALGEELGPPVERERPIMGYDQELLRVNAQVLHDDMARDHPPARR